MSTDNLQAVETNEVPPEFKQFLFMLAKPENRSQRREIVNTLKKEIESIKREILNCDESLEQSQLKLNAAISIKNESPDKIRRDIAHEDDLIKSLRKQLEACEKRRAEYEARLMDEAKEIADKNIQSIKSHRKSVLKSREAKKDQKKQKTILLNLIEGLK